VRVVLQKPPNLSDTQKVITIQSTNSSFYFEIDGNYRIGSDFPKVLETFKRANKPSHKDLGWQELFDEVFALAEPEVPGVLEKHRQ
jgi:hypothetical protein